MTDDTILHTVTLTEMAKKLGHLDGLSYQILCDLLEELIALRLKVPFELTEAEKETIAGLRTGRCTVVPIPASRRREYNDDAVRVEEQLLPLRPEDMIPRKFMSHYRPGEGE